MTHEVDVIDLNGNRRSVSSERDRLQQAMFECLLYADDDEAWNAIADRLAARRGHLREVSR
ncbi:hypothetical protein GCM10009105_27660 [Dokdonella soli]|uniref:Uncharacterized protein n=2 Tax=Dokdonella soli TaxID=529810 RepID=A0ABN1IQD3_9GAMM